MDLVLNVIMVVSLLIAVILFIAWMVWRDDDD